MFKRKSADINSDEKKSNVKAPDPEGSLTTKLDSMNLKSDRSGKKTEPVISYAAGRVIGNGSFGIVYEAVVVQTQETVAIKKVLQDPRYKNRELQIMGSLDHCSVVTLKHCFYSKGDGSPNPTKTQSEDLFLNLVMEYIPETIHRTLQNHTKAQKLVSIMLTKVYVYQILRAVAYIHSVGVCHRDIKPQNLLLNPKTQEVKLCDFGSAKVLVKGEPNVAYICSRYYRAPELVFEATEYTSAIDVWSVGCVFGELLLGSPLFPGDSGVNQLFEIIKVLGTPTRAQIYAMNPNHTTFDFPQIKPHPWAKVFRKKAPQDAMDLIAQLLVYEPNKRPDALTAMTHPFFDALRVPGATLPNEKPLPELFNFTDDELRIATEKGILTKLVPPEILKKFRAEGRVQ